ncbi:hypothetical protein PIB30_094590 [Stylosanthes scabra]|uniref:CCHC-type domain-containing protein n=1 Tax=Stylosanthes scabra TaxID=79078 RepID=A0ABU6UWN4_9FABA|nr:hypothetical protein [Stylosanthes scabra]
MICFSCGKYGHKADSCLENYSVQNNHGQGVAETTDKGKAVDTESIGNETNMIQGESSQNNDPPDFGPWMMVKRSYRKKADNSAPTKKNVTNGKNISPNNERKETNSGSTNKEGSRFTILEAVERSEEAINHAITKKNVSIIQKGPPTQLTTHIPCTPKQDGPSSSQAQIPKVITNETLPAMASPLLSFEKRVLKQGAGKNPQT